MKLRLLFIVILLCIAGGASADDADRLIADFDRKADVASATAGVQPYKYGAKELDRENGLDLYDSHARWYDSMIGRTTSQDPLAEKYYHLSPYLWCAANPIKFGDKNGMYLKGIDGNPIRKEDGHQMPPQVLLKLVAL